MWGRGMGVQGLGGKELLSCPLFSHLPDPPFPVCPPFLCQFPSLRPVALASFSAPLGPSQLPLLHPSLPSSITFFLDLLSGP